MSENSNNPSLYPVIVIVGPTAVSKTNVSLNLAKKINAEIVSADSRQIYKFMNVGTAKPADKERQGIKHHFIDFISPNESFSSGAYGNKAREVILDLRSKNKNVIVVGGSGLYIRALLYGMVSFDKKDETIRQNLKQQLEQGGLPKLFQELKKVDPELAKQLSENDTQRILRGLEVFQMSGKKLSSMQQEKESPAPFPYLQIGLNMDREMLYQRINKRVEQMFEQGLIDEVQDLINKGFAQTNAIKAVGYKEVVQYLNKEITYLEMVQLIQRNSRRYAKRQFTWFRKDESIRWFDLPDNKVVEKITRIFI